MPRATGEPMRRLPDGQAAAAILRALDAALYRFEAHCLCDGRSCDWCILRRDLAAIVGHLERMARDRR